MALTWKLQITYDNNTLLSYVIRNFQVSVMYLDRNYDSRQQLIQIYGIIIIKIINTYFKLDRYYYVPGEQQRKMHKARHHTHKGQAATFHS